MVDLLSVVAAPGASPGCFTGTEGGRVPRRLARRPGSSSRSARFFAGAPVADEGDRWLHRGHTIWAGVGLAAEQVFYLSAKWRKMSQR